MTRSAEAGIRSVTLVFVAALAVGCGRDPVAVHVRLESPGPYVGSVPVSIASLEDDGRILWSGELRLGVAVALGEAELGAGLGGATRVELRPRFPGSHGYAATVAVGRGASHEDAAAAVRLPALGVLEVRVVDDRGSPAAHLPVFVQALDGVEPAGPPQRGETDDLGFMRIAPVAIGAELFVHATAADDVRQQGGHVTASAWDGSTARCSVVLTADAVDVRGVVVDSAGEPVAERELVLGFSMSDPHAVSRTLEAVRSGARVVQLGRLSTRLEDTTTDARGRFEHRIHRGDYEEEGLLHVSIRAADLEGRSEDLVLDANGSALDVGTIVLWSRIERFPMRNADAAQLLGTTKERLEEVAATGRIHAHTFNGERFWSADELLQAGLALDVLTPELREKLERAR